MSPVYAVDSAQVSSFDLEHELVSAFQNLELEKASSLIAKGANPNQLLHMNCALLNRYIQLDSLDLEIDAYLETEEDAEIFAEILFFGQLTHPILFVSTLIKEEQFAIDLLASGAAPIFELPDPAGSPKDYKINVLQLASALNCQKLAEHLILNLGFNIMEPAIEEDLSPIQIAIVSGNLDMLKLFLELCPNQVFASHFDNDFFLNAFLGSKEEEEVRTILKDNGIEL